MGGRGLGTLGHLMFLPSGCLSVPEGRVLLWSLAGLWCEFWFSVNHQHTSRCFSSLPHGWVLVAGPGEGEVPGQDLALVTYGWTWDLVRAT